jgi:hypothetical protein
MRGKVLKKESHRRTNIQYAQVMAHDANGICLGKTEHSICCSVTGVLSRYKVTPSCGFLRNLENQLHEIKLDPSQFACLQGACWSDWDLLLGAHSICEGPLLIRA